nr:uroporphyrinogen decarboxylase family protein [Candidatus Njordarchaeum guaymaensis]
MSSEERIWKAVNLEEPDRVPCVIDVGFQAAKLARISVKELMFDPIKANAAGKRVWENYRGGFDMWDSYSSTGLIYVAPIPNSHCVWWFNWKLPGIDLPDDSLPQMVEVPIIEKVEDYKTFIEKGLSHYTKKLSPKLNEVYMKCMSEGSKVVAESEKWFKDRLLPTNFLGSLFEAPCDLISFLRSFKNYLVDMVRNPDEIIAASEAIQPQLLKTAIDLKGFTKCKVVLLGTSRASTSFLSPKQFETVCWPFIRQAAEELMKKDLLVLFHLDNVYDHVLEYFRELPRKKAIFHFDKTDIFKAKKVLGDHSCIMGNVPPTLLTLGTTSQVDEYCRKLIETCGEGGGYILAQACTVPYDAKFENVKTMKDSVKKYNPYK